MQKTLEMIDRPEYLHLLLNPDSYELALSVCKKWDKDAIRVYYTRKCCEIYSIKLMQKMVSLDCRVRKDYIYKLAGQISQNKKMVTFRLNDAVMVEK